MRPLARVLGGALLVVLASELGGELACLFGIAHQHSRKLEYLSRPPHCHTTIKQGTARAQMVIDDGIKGNLAIKPH